MNRGCITTCIFSLSIALLSGCGEQRPTAPALSGTYTCASSVYVFTPTTWSALNSPSKDLPYRIEGNYVHMRTLAGQSVPMLKTRDGALYMNTDGLDDGWGSPCTKRG